MALIDCLIKIKVFDPQVAQKRVDNLMAKGMPVEEAEATVKNQIINEEFAKLNKEMNKIRESLGLPTEKVNRLPLVDFEDMKSKTAPPRKTSPPKQPPVDQEPGEKSPPSPKNKAILDRIIKSDITNPAIKRGVEERGASYIPKGLDLTLAEAKALIELYGDKADQVVRDLTNGITPDARVAMTAKLYEKYVAEGNNEAAVDIAMWQAEQSLQAGRASNAAKIWKMITESGEENIVLSIERERQAQRDKLVEPVAQELQQTREQIEAEIRKQVEARVQKEVGSRLEKAKLITKEKRKEIADFFDGLKVDTKNKGMLSASVIPGITLLPHVWNAAVDVIKQAVLTGSDVANAIQAGIDYIKENQPEPIDEDIFREFMTPKVEAIMPKQKIEPKDIDEKKIKVPKLKGRKKKEFIDEVIKAHNEGKLTDKKFEDIYAGKLGFKEFSEEDRGRIRELAKTISKAEEFEKELRDNFTPENIKKFKEYVKDAKRANDLLQEFAQKPNTIDDTLISIMQGNLLSTMSLVANIFYNLNYQPLRFTSTGIGSMIDFSLSKLAKLGLVSKALESRAIDFTALQKGYFKGGWNGAMEGLKQLVTGVDTDVRNLREIQSNFSPKRAIQRWAEKDRTLEQKVNDYVEGTIGWEAELMFRLLNLGDKPWRRAAEMARSMEIAEQKGLKGQELQKFLLIPDPESAELIKKAGDEATFQQSDKWGKMLQGGVSRFLNSIAEIPIIGKSAKVILKSQLPYIKTPWNLIAETIQYAAPPLTLGIGIREIAKGNKREGSVLIGKAFVGAMIQAVAYQLFIKGLLTGDDDKEKKKRDFQMDFVPPANSINTSAVSRGLATGDWDIKDGDTWVSYSKMGVTGVLFDSYSNTYKGRVAEGQPILEPDTYIQDLFTTGPKVASSTLDQTFLTGTSKLLEAIKDGGNRKTTDWLITTSEALASIAYPNTIATISKGTDEYLRDIQNEDAWEKMKNVYKAKMFMGDDLTPRVNIWGDRISGAPKGRDKVVYYLFDPSKFRDIPVDDYRYKLYQEFKKDYDADWLPGMPQRAVTINKEKLKLTNNEYELYSILVGKERADATQALINSNDWESLNDQEKKDKLKETYREAAEIGKEEFMISLGYPSNNMIPAETRQTIKALEKLRNKYKQNYP